MTKKLLPIRELIVITMSLWAVPSFAEGQSGMGAAFFIVLLVVSLFISMVVGLIFKLIFRLTEADVSNKVLLGIAVCFGVIFFVMCGKWIFSW